MNVLRRMGPRFGTTSARRQKEARTGETRTKALGSILAHAARQEVVPALAAKEAKALNHTWPVRAYAILPRSEREGDTAAAMAPRPPTWIIEARRQETSLKGAGSGFQPGVKASGGRRSPQ